MKSDELHALVRKNGWVQIRQSGSHIIYQKGTQTYTVPYHKGREVGKGLVRKIIRIMNLNS